MTSISELDEQVRRLLTTRADELARQTGFVKRERIVTGRGFAQAVVLGWLGKPDGTRKQLQHSAVAAGMALSVQGLDQRFTAAGVAFMRALLEAGLTELVTSETTTPILPTFNGVYLTDSTRVAWAGAALKVGVRLEIQRGGLQVCVEDVTRNDQRLAVADAPLPRGALHLGDLGFFKLKRFRDWSAQGVFWLTRYKVGTCLFTPDGQPLELRTVLTGDAPLSLPVRVGSGRHAVQACLLAAPLPADQRHKRLVRLREQARLDQRPLSTRQRDLAAWTLYLTNIPDLSFQAAHLLARIRWQIELLFKFWKSAGALCRSGSALPLRQHLEGYAKLLGLLIAHWTLLVAGWQPLSLGPLDALRLLRAHLPALHRALSHPASSRALLLDLGRDLALAAPRSSRRAHPSAAQLCRSFVYALP